MLKAEQEIVINIWNMTGDAEVFATWPRWRRRVLACNELKSRERGAELVEGSIPAKLIWVRRHLGVTQKKLFPEMRDELLAQQNNEVIRVKSPAQILTGERETTLHAEAITPYWLFIGTDLKNWQDRLGKHPYFVLLQETEYVNGEDTWIYGAIPLSLLTIRKKRATGRVLTEDEKQALRDRLAALRKKAKEA